jgi:phosphoglycerol transferase MdoB-like AlkP superfamily enzyme
VIRAKIRAMPWRTAWLRLVIPTLMLAWPLAASAEQVPGLRWSIVSQGAGHVAWAGHTAWVGVTVENTGTVTWSPATKDNLSYHWRQPDGTKVLFDGLRTSLQTPVRPGQRIALRARVLVPRTTGRLVLQWEMVREGVAWYGPPERGKATVAVLALWQPGGEQLALLLATVALAVFLRVRRRPAAAWWWAAAAVWPIVWVWAQVAIAAAGFADLVNRPLHREAVVLVASGAVLYVLPVLVMPARWRVWVATVIGAVVSVGAFADVLYLRFFGGIVPLAAAPAAGQLGRISESVRALVAPGDGWLLAGVGNAVILAVAWPRWRRDEAPRTRWRLAVAGGTIAACTVAGWPGASALAWGANDLVNSQQVFSIGQRVGEWGVTNLHLLDLVVTVHRWVVRPTLGDEQRHFVEAFFSQRAEGAPARGRFFGMCRGDNVILIQVESLQEWIVHAHVGGREVMPNLAALRRDRRTLYFSRIFDETGQGRSSDGEFDTLNSLHPLPVGAVAFVHAHNHFVALPGILRRHGYATFSAHPFERGFWNRAVLHPRYGFERSMFKRELGEGEQIGWGLADDAFFRRVAPEIDALQRPFFAFLITLGLHHPFDMFPARHKVLDVGRLQDTPLGNYIHAMHYFDESLGDLLAVLEKEGLLDHTIVALYGDHESGLAVNDALLDLAGEPGWDPTSSVRLRRVPFVVLLPGTGGAAEVPTIGTHLDIGPTLLYLLGIERPGSFLGSVLMPQRGIPAVLNDGSAVSDGLMFVAQGSRIPEEGACFTYPAVAPRPLRDCEELRRKARDELEASQLAVDYDLATRLASASDD